MPISSKVSIIIPVYNGEPFLERCLNSISNQAYENIEIIIINDGSTDNTKTICECYLQKEPRVRVIHKKNEGVSIARNVGLDSATGEYIYFVDADDYVLQNGIENLVNKAVENLADLVVAEYYVASSITKNKVSPLTLKDTNGFLCSILSGRNHGALWNKLFSRKCFNEIRFPKNIYYMEDRVLISQILMVCQPKIVFLTAPVYVYWQDEGSVTNSKDIRTLNQFESYIYIAKYLNGFANKKNVMESFSNGAYSSIWFVLKNIDVSLLKHAVSVAHDFDTRLSNMGIVAPSRARYRTVRIMIRFPNPFSFYSFKILRNTLKARSNLLASFDQS